MPISVALTQLECERCHHKWYPRHEFHPKVCPRCKTRLWQTPKVKVVETDRAGVGRVVIGEEDAKD